MTAIGGGMAIKGIAELVNHARKLNDELTRTKVLDGEFAKYVESGQARSAAFRTAQEVPTFAPSDFVRMNRELAAQLQHPQEAEKILPFAAKAAAVAGFYTGEDQEGIIKDLVKIVDLRAKLFSLDKSGKEVIDPAKLGPELEAAVRGLILGGNYLKFGDLLTMAKMMGVPVKTMEQSAFYSTMVEMAVSQGAARAGSAIVATVSRHRL